jgi:hypothetical protein
LYPTRADARWYVPSAAQTRFAEAIDRRRNTLLIGSAGMGKTTTLHMTELALRDAARPAVYVSLGPADDVGQAASAIYRAAVEQGWLEAEDALVAAALRPDDPYAPNALIRRLEAVPSDAVFLVDDVGAEVGHGLFGRLRDELWQHALVWGVAAETGEAHGLLRPPADAFFDARIDLAPLGADERRRLLERRAEADGRLDADAVGELAARSPDSVRGLIGAASAAAESGDPPRTLAIGAEHRRRRAEQAAGRAGAMLATEMEGRGPVSAGDDGLLRTLGWTRPRAVAVLKKLEADGIVRSFDERSDGPGRPRRLYELVPAREFVA